MHACLRELVYVPCGLELLWVVGTCARHVDVCASMYMCVNRAGAWGWGKDFPGGRCLTNCQAVFIVMSTKYFQPPRLGTSGLRCLLPARKPWARLPNR